MKLRIRIVNCQAGGYTAECPVLPGCVTHGETREEAREKLNDAICGYVAAVSDFVPEKLVHEMVEV